MKLPSETDTDSFRKSERGRQNRVWVLPRVNDDDGVNLNGFFTYSVNFWLWLSQLSYRPVFMNLPGASVVFHFSVRSSRSKLKWERFSGSPVGPVTKTGDSAGVWMRGSSSQQTVVGLAPASDITPAAGLQREQSSIQQSRTGPACRHGPESKHRPTDCKEMRLD